MNTTNKYKYCNHHHELTENHSIVNFGDEEFVANNKAIPLLKTLNELGLKTRTHHIDDNGGFFSILIKPNMNIEIKTVDERDSSRSKYNGEKEVLISWRK